VIRAAQAGGDKAQIKRFTDAYEKSSGKFASGSGEGLFKSTREVANLREELEGLQKSAGVFDSLSKEIANGTVSIADSRREFQKMQNLLIALDPSQKLYNESIREFNALAASGDKQKLADYLTKLSALFSHAAKPKVGDLRAAMTSTTSVLDGDVAELESRKSALLESPPSAARDTALQGLNDKLKDTRAAIDTVNGVVKDLDDSTKSAFNPNESAKITSYLDDVMTAAKAFGEAFKDFAPDAENDPVDRIMARHRRSLELGREALGQIQGSTNAESAKTRGAAQDNIAGWRSQITDSTSDGQRKSFEGQIDLQQKIIDKQNEADQIIKTRISLEDEKLQKLQRELESEEAILRLKRASNDAGRAASDRSLSARFGLTESDKDANQAGFAFQSASATIDTAFQTRATSSPVDRASMLGSALQNEAIIRGNLLSMSSRVYQIDADRRQVAIDTAEAMKEQTRQASKAFQMADRGDQLRAAALSKTIRDKGPVGMNEFSMLGQNTRNALTTYLPDKAPGMLNEARYKGTIETQKLNAEQQRLVPEVARVSLQLAAITEQLSKDMRKGRPLDVTKGALPKDSLQNSAARENQPVINVGDVNVNVDVGAQFVEHLKGYLDDRLAAGFAALQSATPKSAPNSQHATE